MEPVTKEEIESVFGEDYDSLTIDKNVTLTYRYKKSDKKNLLLIFMGNQESDHFTSSSLQYEPIRENLDGQKE